MLDFIKKIGGFVFKKRKKCDDVLKFFKCRAVKTPTVAYCENDNPNEFEYGVGTAGIDLFVPDVIPLDDVKSLNAVSMDKWVFNAPKNQLILEKHCRIIIPSGLKVNIPEGYALIGFNKSGVAAKKGLILGACVIDENYTGEILINVINTDDRNVVISANDKLAQFVLIKLPRVKVKMVDTAEELFKDKISTRQEGGFGSSCLKEVV
jgi:dUTP pyrophosphatase